MTPAQAVEKLAESAPCVDVESTDSASAGLTQALEQAALRVRQRSARTVVAILTTDALVATADSQWDNAITAARGIDAELWAWSTAAASDSAIRDRLAALTASPDRVQASPALSAE